MPRGRKRVIADPAAITPQAEPQAAVAESTAPAPDSEPVADTGAGSLADSDPTEAAPESPASTAGSDSAQDDADPALESEDAAEQPLIQESDEIEASAQEMDREEYPRRIRVTNNTRMPVQIAVVPLAVGPAPESGVVIIHHERDYDAMMADLDALRHLNGFGEDAFLVESIPDEDDKA